MKKQTYKMNSIGPSGPIFLYPNSGEARVFLDVEKASIKLQYSFDPPYQFVSSPREVEWTDYEVGLIESDFACAFKVPPTAIRVYVRELQKSVYLEVHQRESEENGR